ncbi:MAG: insulinase family protein, partial [Chlamydiia bacterium]|nr:insulinase family protein [Chlamydiia bacterium]
DLNQVIETFKMLKEKLFHLSAPHLILSCDEKEHRILRKEKFFGLGALDAKPFTPWESPPLPQKTDSLGYILPSPVAFSAFGLTAPTILDPSSPALNLTTDLLENTYLHKKVREQGGAYGCRANYNVATGNFYFYAYRDPHIRVTFDAFQEGINRIASGTFTDRDLHDAKLGAIQSLDSPISPGSRANIAYAEFREGLSKKRRQEFRDHLLHTTKEEIVEVARKHLQGKEGRKVSFAGKTLLEKENPGLTIHPI